MHIISVLGRKGGTGKTMISHLLSYGLAAAGYPVVMVQTDVRADGPREMVIGRPYMTIGISGTPEEAGKLLAHTVATAQRLPNTVLILDGGANRRNIDKAMAEMSDMVLIPAAPGSEDIAVAVSDYKEIGAFLRDKQCRAALMAYVLNKWPADKRRQATLLTKPWVTPFLAESEKLRLGTVIPNMQSAMDLGFDMAPNAPVPVRRAARELADEIRAILQLPPPVNEPLVEPDVEAAIARTQRETFEEMRAED